MVVVDTGGSKFQGLSTEPAGAFLTLVHGTLFGKGDSELSENLSTSFAFDTLSVTALAFTATPYTETGLWLSLTTSIAVTETALPAVGGMHGGHDEHDATSLAEIASGNPVLDPPLQDGRRAHSQDAANLGIADTEKIKSSDFFVVVLSYTTSRHDEPP